MNFLRFTALFLVLLLFSNFFYGQLVNISNSPSWVIAYEVPSKSLINKYDVNSGAYTTLYDRQINFVNNTDFLHTATNVLTHGGVTTASELYLSYDSSYQQLNFHYLYIIRNGKKIDKTMDLSFELLNNETNLQSGIYSGKVTAYDILEDIRKGDIIEYAYSIEGQNPIFEEYKYALVLLQGENPVDKLHLRFLYDKKQDYPFKCFKCEDYKLSNPDNDQYKEIVVEGKNIPKIDFEESASPHEIQYSFANLSSYGNWKEVEEWAKRVFSLNEQQNFEQVKDEIFTEAMNQQHKIDAIINFVQDEIRYMGVESGIGSHQPFTPEQVLKQRFGDCKDKALLAAELLKSIGINEAYPVLVNNYFTKGLEQFLPSGQMFDHCILYFNYENQPYWVDLTIAQQGGSFKNIATPDYGEVIIIGKGNYKLTDMNIDDVESKSVVEEVFDVSSFTEDGTLVITSKYYGSKADYFRAALEYYSLDEFSDSYRETFSKLYPKISIKEKLKVQDDIEANVLTTIESYRIKQAWDITEEGLMSQKVFQYEPLVLYNYVSHLDCEEKKFSVAIPYPSDIELKVQIKFPKEIQYEQEKESITNKAFKFSYETNLIGKNTIENYFKFKTLTEEVSSEEYIRVCDDMNALIEDLPFQIYYRDLKQNKTLKSANRKSKKKRKEELQEVIEQMLPIDEAEISDEEFLFESDTNQVFTLVENMPEFPGGQDSLLSFISKNIRYPAYEKTKKIEGTVYASYIVNENGKIENIKILRSVEDSKNFDEEVIRVLSSMPSWSPGTMKGKPVKVQYNIPIRFKLK